MNELTKKILAIHKITCKVFNADYFKTFTNSRKFELVKARQVTMVIAHELISSSLQDISGIFNKDHATLIHAKKTINNLITTEEDFRYKYTYVFDKSLRMLSEKEYKKELTTREIIIEIKRKIFESSVNLSVNTNELFNKLESMI